MKTGTMRILTLLVVILVLAPVYLIAAALVIRSGLLNFRGGPLSSQQVSAVWAFVGASFAAGVSLLGLLLTYLHNQRTHQLVEEAENRLRLDSVVKGLELLTDGQEYAPKARVAGSLATVVRLGHVPIALATLRAAWKAGAVDADVATWLIDRVIEHGAPDDINSASLNLLEKSSEMVYEWHNGAITIIPDSLMNWNVKWPTPAKIHFIGALAYAHISVKPETWRNSSLLLVKSLWNATQDPNPFVATTAAKVLMAIAPTTEDLRPAFGTEPTSEVEAERAHKVIVRISGGSSYFPRIVDIVQHIEQWRSAGDAGRRVVQDPPSARMAAQ